MYRYGYKEIKCNYKQNGEILQERCLMIILEDIEKKQYYPHPITHFFSKYYYSKTRKLNTELAAVKKIVPFLNYVLEQVADNNIYFRDVKGISDLKNVHASLYLKKCVQIDGNLNNTTKSKEMYLSKFYKYLDDEGMLKQKPVFKIFTVVKEKVLYETYLLDLTYKRANEEKIRRKVKRKDIIAQNEELNISNNRLRIMKIYELLSLAEQITPDIAFGVGLQIFAGLRKGEVVNLLRKSLKPQNASKYGENGLIVKVRNNQEKLFDRLTSHRDVGTKKTRDQACLIDPILCHLYKVHLEKVLPKYKNIKNKNALFYDSEGQPMSGDTYDKRFLKLKETYLGKLLATPGRKADYDDLEDTRWRSHIGRGIFTNMCHDAGFSIQQTAILRGDSTTEAMKSYFDIISATHNIARALEFMSPIDNNKSEFNESEFILRKNEVLSKL